MEYLKGITFTTNKFIQNTEELPVFEKNQQVIEEYELQDEIKDITPLKSLNFKYLSSETWYPQYHEFQKRNSEIVSDLEEYF